jgi:hypothetical protein
MCSPASSARGIHNSSSKAFASFRSGVSNHSVTDVILGKPLSVLPETELLQPISDLLHRGSAPDYRAS